MDLHGSYRLGEVGWMRCDQGPPALALPRPGPAQPQWAWSRPGVQKLATPAQQCEPLSTS